MPASAGIENLAPFPFSLFNLISNSLLHSYSLIIYISFVSRMYMNKCPRKDGNHKSVSVSRISMNRRSSCFILCFSLHLFFCCYAVFLTSQSPSSLLFSLISLLPIPSPSRITFSSFLDLLFFYQILSSLLCSSSLRLSGFLLHSLSHPELLPTFPAFLSSKKHLAKPLNNINLNQ